jgi:hypothetical protein
MAIFNDLAAVVAVILPSWPCVEFYRETDANRRVIIRPVQGGASDRNMRRFVYQFTLAAGDSDAESVYTATEQLLKHFLDNHRAGGVLLARVVRDVTGPFYDASERPYYQFDLSVINTAT